MPPIHPASAATPAAPALAMNLSGAKLLASRATNDGRTSAARTAAGTNRTPAVTTCGISSSRPNSAIKVTRQTYQHSDDAMTPAISTGPVSRHRCLRGGLGENTSGDANAGRDEQPEVEREPSADHGDGSTDGGGDSGRCVLDCRDQIARKTSGIANSRPQASGTPVPSSAPAIVVTCHTAQSVTATPR